MGCGNSTEAVSGVSDEKKNKIININLLIRHNLAKLLNHRQVLEKRLMKRWQDLVMLVYVKNIRQGSYKVLTKKTEIEMMTHCSMLKLLKASNLWQLSRGLDKLQSLINVSCV